MGQVFPAQVSSPPAGSELFACLDRDWSPQIGDPTLMGWVTVAAYGLCAVLLFRTGLSLDRSNRRLWLVISGLLLLLMINKQLDLQTALTAFARCHALIYDWYEDRRIIQIGFILGVAMVAGIGFLTLLFSLRGQLRQNLFLLAGVFLILSFVAIRAAGAHHVDALIGLQVGPLKVNHILELGALSVLALAALVRRT